MIENKGKQPNVVPTIKPVEKTPVVPVVPVKPVVEKKKTEAEIKSEQIKEKLLYLRDNVLQGRPDHVAKIDELLGLVS